MLDKSQLSQPVSENDNLSAQEIARFDALAESWWDPNGKYKTALAFNHARTRYMIAQLASHFSTQAYQSDCLAGITVLDLGCGGGLISEALASCGAQVTGIDASSMSIEVARRHAKMSGLNITYRHCLADDLINEKRQFDVVVNAEVVEHVPDQKSLIKACCALTKPDGALLLATLNRTVKSYIIAIVGAEYVMRYLPKGTHSWQKFVKPQELQQWVQPEGLVLVDSIGMRLNPFNKKWSFTSSMAVNYLQYYAKTR